jgi:hypothetical protein
MDIGNDDRVIFFDKIDKLAYRFQLYELINPQISYKKYNMKNPFVL